MRNSLPGHKLRLWNIIKRTWKWWTNRNECAPELCSTSSALKLISFPLLPFAFLHIFIFTHFFFFMFLCAFLRLHLVGSLSFEYDATVEKCQRFNAKDVSENKKKEKYRITLNMIVRFGIFIVLMCKWTSSRAFSVCTWANVLFDSWRFCLRWLRICFLMPLVPLSHLIISLSLGFFYWQLSSLKRANKQINSVGSYCFSLCGTGKIL